MLLKYPEFRTSHAPSPDEDFLREFKPLVLKIKNKTLGQKISELKEVGCDVNLISKLEELNQERRVLVHTASAEDKEGDASFFGLLSESGDLIAHDFEKIIKIFEEIYWIIS